MHEKECEGEKGEGTCSAGIGFDEVIFVIEWMFLLKDALFLLGYMTRTNIFPKPLERAEEAKLIEAMQQGDESAREKLIEHNLRLAAHIAKKYTVPGFDQDDLISIGTVGLIKGVNTFKAGTGTQLSTYCARCIENAILSPMEHRSGRRIWTHWEEKKTAGVLPAAF